MTEAAPISTALTQDVLCIGCGYNLRGLEPAGRCPECGLSIADSNRGDRLIYADPTWLEKLRFGASLKLWNILITILIGFVGGFLVGFMKAPQQIVLIVGMIGASLGLWATFCITTQEPRTALTEDPVTLRKVIRTCALTAFAGGLLQQLGGNAFASGSTLRSVALPWIMVGLISSVAGVIVMIGELKYFRRFAMRAPDLKLARSTRIVMWGLAVSTCATSVGGVLLAMIFASTPGALAATGPATTSTTLNGIGYTSTVTTAAGAATPSKSGTTTGGPTPATPPATMTGIAPAVFGVGACVFGLAVAIFFLWYVSLLSRYRKLFQGTITQIQAGLEH